MKAFFLKIKQIKDDVCVSIIINTHRTKPDYEKDPLNLKNHIKIAEEKLVSRYDKKIYMPILDKIYVLAQKIDHSHNLESLLLFANKDFAEYIRLAVPVVDRTIVDKTFATRDIVRAMHSQEAYYVLVISRTQARLIEAFNDNVIKEFKDTFPLENNLFPKSKTELSNTTLVDNYIKEFFNKVDNTFSEITKQYPLPIVIACEKRNFQYYLEITKHKDAIIGHINKNRDADKDIHIVFDAWSVVKEFIDNKNHSRIAELRAAVSAGKVITDLSDIWEMANQGRAKTIFVKKRTFQRAIIEENKVIPVDENFESTDNKYITDDIYDEIIEIVLEKGGDAVFLEPELMNDINSNIALVLRY